MRMGSGGSPEYRDEGKVGKSRRLSSVLIDPNTLSSFQ